MRYKVRFCFKKQTYYAKLKLKTIKGQFSPSYLLCPEAYSWHTIEFCLELLNKKKYCRFSDKDVKDNDLFKNTNDISIRAKFRESESRVFKFNEFCRFLNSSFVPQFTHLINGYCKLFGCEFSKRVIIKF